MKKFIINILIFILPIVIVAYSYHLYLLYSGKYKKRVVDSEIKGKNKEDSDRR
jgi:hypothetical protein